MKYKNSQKILFIFASVFLLAASLFNVSPPKAYAAIEEACPDGHMVRFNPGSSPTYAELCANHQTGGPAADDTETANAADPSRGANLTADCSTAGNCCEGESLTKDNCVIIGYILTITNVLSGLVGLVVVLMIAYGGIQYAMSRDDPAQVAAAKERIKNAVMALVFYLFAVAFLQWLIPGGIF